MAKHEDYKGGLSYEWQAIIADFPAADAGDKRRARATFSAPSVEEVAAYCKERGNSVDAQAFVDFYISKGWKDVRPNVKGEWIDCSEDGYVECPICGSLTTCEDNKDELRFCWNCGAEMRG